MNDEWFVLSRALKSFDLAFVYTQDRGLKKVQVSLGSNPAFDGIFDIFRKTDLTVLSEEC